MDADGSNGGEYLQKWEPVPGTCLPAVRGPLWHFEFVPSREEMRRRDFGEQSTHDDTLCTAHRRTVASALSGAGIWYCVKEEMRWWYFDSLRTYYP